MFAGEGFGLDIGVKRRNTESEINDSSFKKNILDSGLKDYGNNCLYK